MNAKRGEPVPDDLTSALQACPDVLARWDTLHPSCPHRPLEHRNEAKQRETGPRRIGTVLKRTKSWYRSHHLADANG